MTPKDIAESAAQKAGKMIKDSLGKISSCDIENKDAFDYVTTIDKKAERLIIDSIQEYYPHHEIFAEESGKSKHHNKYCWIIDPLDGTTNFIHGYPNSAVSIAFQEEGRIILGVIYDPYRDELFSAEKGKGAFLNDQQIVVSKRTNLNTCLIATGFPFKNKNLLDQYWNVLSEIFMKVSGIRRTGSAALDLAHIACGRFDGFWELRLSPWDIAAGSIIIKEANGKISDFEGKDNFIRTGNVIASNKIIYDFLLNTVRKIFPKNP